MARNVSFAKLDEQTWGIRVDVDLGQPFPAAGDVLDVIRKDGSVTQVTVASKVATWNGGRAGHFTIQRPQRGNGNGPARPAAPTAYERLLERVQLAKGELGEALMKDGEAKDAAIGRALEQLFLD
jgi:hypothetical protein